MGLPGEDHRRRAAIGDVVKAVVGGVIFGAIAFFTGGAGIGLFGTTTLLGSIGVGAAVGGVTGVLGVLARPKIPDFSQEFGRELQLNGDPLAPRKPCYGEAWTAGTLRWHGATGENNNDLYLVIVLVGHEIDSVQTAEFDGDTLTLDGSGNVTAPSKWAGLINVRYYLGTDTQTTDATLDSTFAEWTSNHRLRGTAYAIVKLTFDEEQLASMPQMRFKVRGAKVYDWRKDSTNGGSGLHRLNDPSTWEWSQNAVLCAADFMRGRKVNGRPICGMRVADTRIDPANAIAEANVCDEQVSLAAGGTHARYTVDGFIDPRQDHGQNLRHFEMAIAGDITFADGKWRFFAGAFRTPTLSLEDKHFIGPLTHVVHKGKAQRVNAAQGAFASAVDSGDVLDYPPVRLASAVAGEEEWLPLGFALVSDGARAQRCAKLLLEREAAGKRINGTTSLYGYRAVPGETINVTHAAFGLSLQIMRVLDVELAIVQGQEGNVGLAVNLVLEAGPASLYTWDAEETALAAAPKIPQAQVPFEISFPGIFTDLTNALVNPSLETGSLGGWTVVTGSATWAVGTIEPRFGTYSLQTTNAADGRIRNSSRLQVEQGDRVLAQGFCQTAGAGSGSARINLIFRDAAEVVVSSSFGNSVTGTDYGLSRIIAAAPAGAVIVDFEFELLSTVGRNGIFDGAYLTIIPKDADIDALQTTNAPAEAGADVTEPRLLGNGLVNPSFETGTLEGWTHVAGTNDWEVDNVEPHVGTFGLEKPATAGRIRNSSRLQVSEGDRVLAMGFVQTTGAGSADVRVNIRFRDAAGVLVNSAFGNIVNGTSYALSRTLGVAGAGVALADFEFEVLNSVGRGGRFDGAYMQIMPKDADFVSFDGDGLLIEDIAAGDGSTFRPVARGPEAGSARDGDVITFSPAWNKIPTVRFISGGISFSPTLNNSQALDFQAVSLSGSGFTASLKIKELVGTETLHTDTTVSTPSSPAGLDHSINKSQTNEAHNDQYTLQYDVTINNFNTSEPGSVSVGFYTNDGTGWVQRATQSFFGDIGDSQTVRANQTRIVTVDGLGLNDDFGINVESDQAGGSSLNFDSVKYTTATASATETATPAGAPDVQYLVIGG